MTDDGTTCHPPVLQGVNAELLAEAIGRELLRDLDHPAWRDERFLDWLAREARDRARRTPGSPDRLSDAEFRARGEALQARAAARQLRVSVRHARPCTRARPFIRDARATPAVELGIAAGIGRELWDEPVDSWVELPQEVPDGDYLALKIVGDSMAPLMHTGDTVLLRLGGEVARETVIVARHPENGYVCKRVSGIRHDAIELSSLEPGGPAMVIPREPGLVLGTVILLWCHHRRGVT